MASPVSKLQNTNLVTEIVQLSREVDATERSMEALNQRIDRLYAITQAHASALRANRGRAPIRRHYLRGIANGIK